MGRVGRLIFPGGGRDGIEKKKRKNADQDGRGQGAVVMESAPAGALRLATLAAGPGAAAADGETAQVSRKARAGDSELGPAELEDSQAEHGLSPRVF